MTDCPTWLGGCTQQDQTELWPRGWGMERGRGGDGGGGLGGGEDGGGGRDDPPAQPGPARLDPVA